MLLWEIQYFSVWGPGGECDNASHLVACWHVDVGPADTGRLSILTWSCANVDIGETAWWKASMAGGSHG